MLPRARFAPYRTTAAVALQRISREHHATTSLGTVYRFLRELHTLNLLQAHVSMHDHPRWRRQAIHAAPPIAPAEPVAASCRVFMRELESVGLAETRATGLPAAPHKRQCDTPPPLHEMLQALAFHLGYRLS